MGEGWRLERQAEEGRVSRTLGYSREKCWVFFKGEGGTTEQCRQKAHSNFYLKAQLVAGQGRAGRSLFQKKRQVLVAGIKSE